MTSRRGAGRLRRAFGPVLEAKGLPRWLLWAGLILVAVFVALFAAMTTKSFDAMVATVAVLGIGKRTGKTAVTGETARVAPAVAGRRTTRPDLHG